MSSFTPQEIAYLQSQLLGRLATVGADGDPHVVPVGFRYNPDLDTIDIGGHGIAQSKKYRDVARSGRAAFVVDDLVSADPWTPRMLAVRGQAEVLPSGGQESAGLCSGADPHHPDLDRQLRHHRQRSHVGQPKNRMIARCILAAGATPEPRSPTRGVRIRNLVIADPHPASYRRLRCPTASDSWCNERTKRPDSEAGSRSRNRRSHTATIARFSSRSRSRPLSRQAATQQVTARRQTGRNLAAFDDRMDADCEQIGPDMRIRFA